MMKELYTVIGEVMSLRFQEYRLDKDNNLFNVVDDQSQFFQFKMIQ